MIDQFSEVSEVWNSKREWAIIFRDEWAIILVKLVFEKPAIILSSFTKMSDHFSEFRKKKACFMSKCYVMCMLYVKILCYVTTLFRLFSTWEFCTPVLSRQYSEICNKNNDFLSRLSRRWDRLFPKFQTFGKMKVFYTLENFDFSKSFGIMGKVDLSTEKAWTDCFQWRMNSQSGISSDWIFAF